MRRQMQEFGGTRLATLIGVGESAPDPGALYRRAPVRYFAVKLYVDLTDRPA